jgi:MscS family membrane protein
MHNRRFLLLLILILAPLGVAAPAMAQDAPAGVDLSSPRATVKSFIEALNPPAGGEINVEAAVACLDYSGVDSLVRWELRELLAFKLKQIIDRKLVVYDQVPDYQDVDPAQQLPFTLQTWKSAQIVISKGEDELWRFSAETVAAIPQLQTEALKKIQVAGKKEIAFADSKTMWIESKVPPALRKTGFLLAHWQWIGLLILCILGIVIERIVAGAIPALFRRALRKRRLDVGKTTARVGFRPFGVLAMGLTWWMLLGWLGLPPRIYLVLVVAVRFLSAAAGVWSAYRLVDVVSDILKRKAAATETKFDDLLVPLFRKSLKVFVTVVGLVFLASVLKINVTSLLAGLGLGGLAFTLAAQDSVKNLFGSMTVIMDRPFHVGDWVKIGSTEGSVEEVGFRSTRVRTFYNSRITVPNGNLISAVVDNMGARRYRRVKTVLSITYDTSPEKIDAFCEGIRELIRRHPYTRKDYFHVYLNQFAGSSLDVLLYTFLETPEWGTELRERHRLFNDILRLAKRLGVEFAFPTQTVHLVKDSIEDAGEAPLPDRSQIEDAHEQGRREARAIVAGTLGDPMRIPPPVGALIPERENRGEGEDGGE